ncbi:MAG: DUF975 family protein [Paludibacteraceae bacterium]|nr:DUF975 family protein [Paludibacteraceae bacterium]
MEIENALIKERALAILNGHWGNAALTTLVSVLLSSVVGAVLNALGLGIVSVVLIDLPLGFGFTLVFNHLMKTGDGERMVQRMFNIAYGDFSRSLAVSVLQAVFNFLWFLLLIIPGIIKMYSYAMTYYIAEDYPELDANKCIDKSKEMMDGYKFDLFLLHLSFLGWALLCILTLGIGALWLRPYIATSEVVFYERLKEIKGIGKKEDPVNDGPKKSRTEELLEQKGQVADDNSMSAISNSINSLENLAKEVEAEANGQDSENVGASSSDDPYDRWKPKM